MAGEVKNSAASLSNARARPAVSKSVPEEDRCVPQCSLRNYNTHHAASQHMPRRYTKEGKEGKRTHVDESLFVPRARVRDRLGSIFREELNGRERVDAVLGCECTVDLAIRVGDFRDHAL